MLLRIGYLAQPSSAAARLVAILSWISVHLSLYGKIVIRAKKRSYNVNQTALRDPHVSYGDELSPD